MRVLTFNSHEAYIHNLAQTGYPMDVVCDLPGHHFAGWDARMRPLPENVRVVSIADLSRGGTSYDCVIGHTLSDLLAAKDVASRRRILVLHSSLTGRIEQEGASVSPEALRETVRRYLELTETTLVMISEMKAESWGLPATVIRGAVDVASYGPWEGDIAEGLRVANHVTAKSAYLDWPLHERVFDADHPCRLVGENPDLAGVAPAENWNHLRELLRHHRFFVHTARAGLEDGYNLASLEAMATGLPVVSNANPSCPIEDGVSGVVSDDPEALQEGTRRLLEDREYARHIGAAGRDVARERFSLDEFVTRWQRVIEGTG